MNKKKVLISFYLLILLIAIIITLVGSKEYSQTLCISILVFCVFLVIHYLAFTNRLGLFSFDLFFLLGIILTSFLYPVFFLGNEFLIAFSKVNPDIINKATLVSFIGIVSFLLGSVLVMEKAPFTKVNYISIKGVNLKRIVPIALAINIFLVSGFIISGGLNYTEAYNFSKRKDLGTSLAFLDFYKISFLVLSILIFSMFAKNENNNIRYLLSRINKVYIFSFLFIVGLLLYGGTRNLPIQLLILVIGLYNIIISKISTRMVLTIALIGVLVFTAIRISRENIGVSGDVVDIGTESFQDDAFLTLTSDLLVSSAPLYVLMDKADTEGFAYGKPMLLPFLSSIPFGQFAVISLFNINLLEFEPTSMLATYLIFGSFDSGAGTNVIGDLYYSWGIVGVILLMLILGAFVSFLGNKIIQNGKIEYLLVYMGLFSISFFFARAEFMYGFRYILWSFLLFKLFMYVGKQLSHTAELKAV